MEFDELIKPGMKREDQFLVEERFTAAHVGSGSLRVLSTPSMIGFMERVSMLLLAEHLPEEYSSVGVSVEARHLAPTPVGEMVRVQSQIENVEGTRVTFLVQTWDQTELVGECRHQRVIINTERFLRRVQAKLGDTAM